MNYRSLCTKYYEVKRPVATRAEIDFYEQQLRAVDGPYLEGMCGSGQFLLPLAERGLDVEGFDLSPHMCERGRQRGATVYEGAMETIELPKKYGAIFVATGSFQVCASPRPALANLARHLKPGGVVFIEAFVPWKEIETGRSDRLVHQVDVGDDSIRLDMGCEVDREQQLMHNTMHFALIREGEVVEEEVEELLLRWHYRYEMELLLEQSGFGQITRIVPDDPYVPHSTVYRAIC